MVRSIRVRSRAILALPFIVVSIVAAFAFAGADSDVDLAVGVETSLRADEAVFVALDALQAERAFAGAGIGALPAPTVTDDAVDRAATANPQLGSLRDRVASARLSGSRADYSAAIADILELPVGDATAVTGTIDRNLHAGHRLANLEELYLGLAAMVDAADTDGAAAQRLRIAVLTDDYRSSSASAQRFSLDSALAGGGDDELGVVGALAAATEIDALQTETLSSARAEAAENVADATGRRRLYAMLGVLGTLAMLLLAVVADRSLMGQLRHFADQPPGTAPPALDERAGDGPDVDAALLRIVASRLEPSHSSDAPPRRATVARDAPAAVGGSPAYVSREAAIRLGLDPRSTRAMLAEFHDNGAPAIDGQPAPAGLPIV